MNQENDNTIINKHGIYIDTRQGFFCTCMMENRMILELCFDSTNEALNWFGTRDFDEITPLMVLDTPQSEFIEW